MYKALDSARTQRGTIEFDTSKEDGALQKLLDSSRMKDLGWSPKVDLQTGLTNTIQWYNTEGK